MHMLPFLLVVSILVAIAASSNQTVQMNRYLLYDVNEVEGFNLRRDVYVRMANMVRLLRRQDPSWVLVLPPFTQLYHWRSVIDNDKLPWSMFFDIESLEKHVPVIEFYDFFELFKLKVKKGDEYIFPIIEEYYQLQNDREFFKTGVWKEGVSLSSCEEDPEIRLIGNYYRGRFYGYTEIAAMKFSCLTTASDIEVFSNWLSQSTKAHIVMLGHAEIIIHGKYSEWSEEWWTARRSMRYNPILVDMASKFRSDFLSSNDESDGTLLDTDWTKTRREPGSAQGGPYVCFHWRRADYVLSYPEKSPGPGATARQVKKWVKSLSGLFSGISKVYVSTDTNDMEVLRLTKLLEPEEISVFRFKPDRPTLLKIRDGGHAIVDQLICSHARLFVGSYSSTFSFRIQEDRMIMGFSPESTFNRLCGDNETESACDQPTKWKVVYPLESAAFTTNGAAENHEEL